MLAHGVTKTLRQAKIDCEVAALGLIDEQKARLDRREQEEREAPAGQTWEFPSRPDVCAPGDWDYVHFDWVDPESVRQEERRAGLTDEVRTTRRTSR